MVHFCLSGISLVSCYLAVRHQLPMDHLLELVGKHPEAPGRDGKIMGTLETLGILVCRTGAFCVEADSRYKWKTPTKSCFPIFRGLRLTMGQFWLDFGHILPYFAMDFPQLFRAIFDLCRFAGPPGLVFQETAEGSHLGAGSSMVMAFVLHKVSDDLPQALLVGECYV